MLLRSATAALLILSGCATPRGDSADERHRQGSLLHAYGAALTTTGALGAIGAGGALAASDSSIDKTPFVITAVASALLVAGGVALTASGDDRFVPEGSAVVTSTAAPKRRGKREAFDTSGAF